MKVTYLQYRCYRMMILPRHSMVVEAVRCDSYILGLQSQDFVGRDEHGEYLLLLSPCSHFINDIPAYRNVAEAHIIVIRAISECIPINYSTAISYQLILAEGNIQVLNRLKSHAYVHLIFEQSHFQYP